MLLRSLRSIIVMGRINVKQMEPLMVHLLITMRAVVVGIFPVYENLNVH